VAGCSADFEYSFRGQLVVTIRFADYDPFAWVYNRHWGEYAQCVLPVLDVLLLKQLPAGVRVLDLCCGTGQLAALLIARGYQLTGVDRSAEMLRFARENAPAGEYILADAREFTLPSRCQVALSVFDSLNHIMSLEELHAVFHRVRRALLPGSPFFFDLNIREGYLRAWKGAFDIIKDDHVCLTRSQYDDTTRLARMEITLFKQEEGWGWTRSDFTLVQRCYDESAVCAALTNAGFTGIRVYDADRCPAGLQSLPAGRAYFLAWLPDTL
jgi:SAM-dependent methyltransferase